MAAHKARLTYDEVAETLPHLATEEQLSLLEALSSMLKKALSSGQTGQIGKHSLLELEGLGEGLWTKVNVEDYIRDERDSWG